MSATDLDQRPAEQAPGVGWQWDSPTQTYAWWDGTRYTARALWDGAAWEYAGEPPPFRRSRWRWWHLVVVVPVLIALAYGGLIAIVLFHEACCTHNLLYEDFGDAPSAFTTGRRAGYEAIVTDGAYEVTSTTATSSAFWSTAWLARVAGGVQAEVTVTASSDARVGIACIDKTSLGDEVGYLFVLGDGAASLVDLSVDEVRTSVRMTRASSARARTVTIVCDYGGVGGWVDGDRVTSLDLPRRGMYSGYNRIALFFDPEQVGDGARFDDVTVVLAT